jgi:1-deoxy-D-xylulose-5-phosphate synthase
MAYLSSLSGPSDLRALPESALGPLALEIRERLIEVVGTTGGHLGPNLGVVELTIALHRVFESPRDVIIWDTGHQSYVHKMLTGRSAQLTTLRQGGGLSGYPAQVESEHDFVENSHASTSLSYLDGVAKGFALTGAADRCAVAVVGDGSLTGGMCWEALNNIAGAPDRPCVIVLNDNGRSYAPTVGAVGAHLAALRAGEAAPLFEQIGLAYLGPIDGHDVAAMETAFRKARDLSAAVVVHCVTTKGLGYAPAEDDELEKMHAISPPAPPSVTWTDVFGSEMVSIGAARPDVVALSAAMVGPTGLLPFAAAYPDRVFDLGIAEQHTVTSAAGMAIAGLHPVVCVYSTFLNRAFDQLLMDVALHRLPVTFVLDRAGITGSDGPSHHGMWDLTLLGTVPGVRVAAPRDGTQLCALLHEAVDWADGPTVLRFPKASVGAAIPAVDRIGDVDVLRADASRDVLIVATGPLAGATLAAASTLATSDGLGVTVVDPRWILPVSDDLVELASGYDTVVTVEDNGVHGGFGSAVAQALQSAGARAGVHVLGLPQRFQPHDARAALLAANGLDADGIVARVRSAVGAVAAPA